MNQLPPFDALLAFDAVRRHGSVTRAAAELGLTQSAVSHRLRRLEGYLGATLLHRSPAGMTPTPAGTALAVELTGLFDRLSSLRRQCLAAIQPSRLKVAAGPALIDHFLARRLPDFAQAHPRAEVEITAIESDAQARAPEFDLRLLWVPHHQARATSTQIPLVAEAVFPVCAPALLAGRGVPKGAAALTALPILHKGRDGQDDGEAWSWPAWFRRLDIDARPRPRLRFAAIGPAITAAIEGAGIVLARSLLVADALADGRLVRVLPGRCDRPAPKIQVVSWSPALIGDDLTRDFVRWLTATATQALPSRRGHAASPP